MEHEKDFLADYRIEKYERPSVTADVAAFRVCHENQMQLLLIRRGGHPYKDMWALPGGFLEKGETVEECALREMQEETTIRPDSLLPVGIFSEPERDPRGWIISSAYAAVFNADAVRQNASDDAADAQWFAVSFQCSGDGNDLLTLTYADIRLEAVLAPEKNIFGKTSYRILERGGLAFDHAAVIAAALAVLPPEMKRMV